MQVQCLHHDKIDKNVAFKKAANRNGWRWTLNILPQVRDHDEHKFATLLNQVCTMFSSRKFNAFLQNGLWAEATKTAMILKKISNSN